jgi:gas vesicle protein
MKQNTNYALNDRSNSVSAPSYRGSLGYLVIGGTIGATLALLFAPKPGRQLRGDIADVSRKGLETARDKARVLNEKTGEIASVVKEKADAVYDFASRKVGAGAETATDAVISAGDAWAANEEQKRSDRENEFNPRPAIG